MTLLEAAKQALELIVNSGSSYGDNYPTEKEMAIIAALRQAIKEEEKDHTYGYAKHLAEAIFKKHFASDEHYASGQIVWRVNDTVIGILTQIDNMVSDMVRKSEQAEKQEPVNWTTDTPVPPFKYFDFEPYTGLGESKKIKHLVEQTEKNNG